MAASPPRTPLATCNACGSSLFNPLSCAGCLAVYYCDKTCQKTHWLGGHRGSCKDSAAAHFARTRDEAEAGDPSSQYFLGLIYAYGALANVEHNDAEAVRWFRAAAVAGERNAQFNLGKCYAEGRGIAKDEAQAACWYRFAADNGHIIAQNSLGNCYLHGWGVAEDHVQAAKWFLSSAVGGWAEAQINLGLCYSFGRGVPIDAYVAARWFRAAAVQGHAPPSLHFPPPAA
jgi:TPR repeat protein